MKQIFQTRVLQSYIDKQDESLLKDRWQKFQAFKDKIFSIKTMKEEKYQDGFLTNIFENYLGYTKDTTNPKDLDKTPSKGVSPVDQAFRYMYSNSSEFGKYLIVSNFDELRFYIKDQTSYEKLSLFNKEIDEMVFKLYALSDKEIAIVKECVK